MTMDRLLDHDRDAAAPEGRTLTPYLALQRAACAFDATLVALHPRMNEGDRNRAREIAERSAQTLRRTIASHFEKETKRGIGAVLSEAPVDAKPGEPQKPHQTERGARMARCFWLTLELLWRRGVRTLAAGEMPLAPIGHDGLIAIYNPSRQAAFLHPSVTPQPVMVPGEHVAFLRLGNVSLIVSQHGGTPADALIADTIMFQLVEALAVATERAIELAPPIQERP